MKDSFSANRLLANPTSYSLGAPSVMRPDGKASRTPASWRSATASACSCGPASTAAPPGSRWLSRFTAPSHFDFEARPGHGARSSLFPAFHFTSFLEFAMRSQTSCVPQSSRSPDSGQTLVRRLALLGAWLIALVGMAGPAAATDWYAAPGGSASGTCVNAANACTIQRAIDVASANDTVHVAPGNYTFTNNRIVIAKAGLKLVGANSPFDSSSVPGAPVLASTASGAASRWWMVRSRKSAPVLPRVAVTPPRPASWVSPGWCMPPGAGHG